MAEATKTEEVVKTEAAPPPEEPKITKAELKAQLDQALSAIAQFEKFQRDLPGMITRKAAEIVEEKEKAKAAPAAKEPTNTERLAKLEAMIAERDAKLAKAAVENRVRAAAAVVPWVDPEDAVRELLPSAQEKDGKVFVLGSKKIGDQVFENEQLPLEDAFKQLAAKKTHWVKANVQGGSGAAGSSGATGGFEQPVTRISAREYAELQKNPAKMWEYTQKYPQLVREAQDRYLEKKRKGEI